MNKQKLFVGLIPMAALIAPALAVADVNQPQEIIDRPRTTPAGQITVGADIGYTRLSISDPVSGVSVSGDNTALNLGGAYGVNDKLEVGVAYAFALKEFEIKGDLGVSAAYAIIPTGNLTAAVDVGVGYNVLGEALDPLDLGVEVQFKVNDKLAVYSQGGQLSIGLESPNQMDLGLPVAVGYQVNPQIFAHVDTSIGNIGLKDSSTSFIFADFIPLGAGAFFSPSNTMDFGASIFFPDVKHAGDFMTIVGSARLHM